MKRLSQTGLRLSLALLLFMGFTGAVPCLHGQSSSANSVTKIEKVDAPETNSELEGFRHSPAVQNIGRHLGLSTEVTAQIFEDLNSVIMIGAILWFIFRYVPKIYRGRAETLQKQLFDARSATAEAKERLDVVEERLSKLGIEIEALREQTLRESAEDEKHILEAIETEKQRIMASVEQEIAAAGETAKRDLKKYAGNLAVDRALSEIHLTADDDRELIRSLGKTFNKGDRN